MKSVAAVILLASVAAATQHTYKMAAPSYKTPVAYEAPVYQQKIYAAPVLKKLYKRSYSAYKAPAAPAYKAAPVYKAPAYKVSAAPVYKATAAPVYETKPAYKAPAAPVYKAPATPVYETTAYKVPVYETTTAYTATAAPVYKPAAYKAPAPSYKTPVAAY